MIITNAIAALARPDVASATCIPESDSLWHAVKAGIAHTDMGLTAATLILAFATWQLIESKRKQEIHARVARIVHPIKSRHVTYERDTDIDPEHKHTHTVVEYDNHPHTETGEATA